MIARPALALILVAGLSHAQTTFSVMVNGTTFQVDRYTPAGAGPFPLVALGHGFSNSKDNVRGLAQALQADGAVVVAPQFPAGSGDHARNALVLLAAVDATVTAGLGDAQRLAFGGHSAGALAAFLAAAQRPLTRAVVLLDPVDSNGLGAAQVANVMAPTLFEFAPPQMCNTQNNTVPWFTAKQGLKGRFNVPMANHCDPQEPSNSLCTLGCSFATWNMARSGVYKRYARAFFGQFLLGNGGCVESMAVTDAANGTIDQVTMSLGSMCSADGGMGGGSAGGGAAGGASAGGAAAGGSAAGGAAAGGSAAGGSAAGGSAAGGSAGGRAGGTATAGGSAVAGGNAAGGSTAGGTASAGGAASAGGSAQGGGSVSGTCGPLTCTGCCNGLVCVPSSEQTCGMNGGACAICGSGQMCESGRCTATPAPGCGCTSTSELGALVLVTLLGLSRRRR